MVVVGMVVVGMVVVGGSKGTLFRRGAHCIRMQGSIQIKERHYTHQRHYAHPRH